MKESKIAEYGLTEEESGKSGIILHVCGTVGVINIMFYNFFSRICSYIFKL